jgi:threonine/homoserine/homoserine lactone efflux protein
VFSKKKPLLELIIKGIITGFVLSIMIGPVFFILLETSIRRGVKAALAFNIGVILSDILYILIAYIFYAEVSSFASGKHQGFVKIAAGSLFIIFGVITFFKKSKEIKVDEVGNTIVNKGDLAMLVLKGFLLNFANPLVIFYWFSVITLGAKSYSTDGSHEQDTFIYIGILLLSFFSFDFLKILGAKKLRPLVTESVLKRMNQFIGFVFLGFGIVLILKELLKM